MMLLDVVCARRAVAGELLTASEIVSPRHLLCSPDPTEDVYVPHPAVCLFSSFVFPALHPLPVRWQLHSTKSG